MTSSSKDIKTRFPGVFARHRKGCAVERGARCTCKPSFYGIVNDRARRKRIRTPRQASANAAANARRDLQMALDRGETVPTNGLRLADARERFIRGAREGRALNKHGRRYKPSAIDTMESSLTKHVEPVLGRRRMTDIRRGEVQLLVDDLASLSGSRVRGIVNSIRSLYTWAEDRDVVAHNPAARIKLPAMDPTPIERVASPSEFAQLLSVLELVDALAYALAGYGFARRAQIVRLRWQEVDLAIGAIEWGVEWEARKYDASRRVVPCVPPLLSLLKRAYLEQGRPDGSARVCPPHYKAASGLMSSNGLAKRAKARWQAAGLEPITLQEARHTAATWLDAAGVSPKIASVLLGHQTPERQPGAPAITLTATRTRSRRTLGGHAISSRHICPSDSVGRQRPLDVRACGDNRSSRKKPRGTARGEHRTKVPCKAGSSSMYAGSTSASLPRAWMRPLQPAEPPRLRWRTTFDLWLVHSAFPRVSPRTSLFLESVIETVVQLIGFQDQRIRPLCHPSGARWRRC